MKHKPHEFNEKKKGNKKEKKEKINRNLLAISSLRTYFGRGKKQFVA
jgi:hypothetical protein